MASALRRRWRRRSTAGMEGNRWWGGLVVLLRTHKAQQRRQRWLNEGDHELKLGLAMAAKVNFGDGERKEAHEGTGCMRRATAELRRLL